VVGIFYTWHEGDFFLFGIESVCIQVVGIFDTWKGAGKGDIYTGGN
jgi:hypothetical protein